MKKSIKILLLTFIIMIVTIGCSKQNTFLKAMKSLEEYNSSEYSISIGDIELGKDGSDDMSINSMIALIKDVKISGNTLKDEKNELNSKTNMNIDALGMKIPFEVIQFENKAYMSANYMASVEKIMYSVMGMPAEENDSYKELENKYIEITELMNSEDEKKEVDFEKSSKEIQKIFTNYIKKMDKSKFSSEGKVVSAKFDRKDFISLLKDMEVELIKIYPDMNFDELDKIDDSFVMDLEIAINTSEKTADYVFKIGTEDESEELKSITIKVNMKFSNSKEKFEAPKKENIISQENLDELIGDDMDLGDEEYEYEPEPINDEEFQVLLEDFKLEMDEYDISKEEMLEFYRQAYSFTEEQIKALEAIE